MTGISLSERTLGHEVAQSVLDSAGPFEPAAHQSIDDSLRDGSADPVVHAAALRLAFSAGADLRLSRSVAQGWIPGLHELIDSGHVDAAAHALPRLKAAFPERPYLRHMASIFRRLPAAVNARREAFVDDRSSDVQIVRTPGADTVMIAFCGARHHLGISANLLDRWFGQLDSHLIYLRDWQKSGFTGGVASLGRDMATTVESLSGLVGDVGARRVVCLGNSAGASGALRYAGALGAERVLALAPITGGPEYTREIAAHAPSGKAMPWDDLVPLYRESSGIRAHILYGEKNASDREQCLRMAGLPGITVEALPRWGTHHLIPGLIRAGQLDRVLGWLVSEEDESGPGVLNS